MSANDLRFMTMALTLGRRALGHVWPAPAVGCVIVTEGRVVGRGWTQPGGRPHAEAMALAQAGQAARGGTAYVTLEPCCHQGRGGPCAPALIEAGISRVVVAIGDPDPRVSGQGLETLRSGGVPVDVGLCAEAASEMHSGFLQRLAVGRPLVTLKLAASLDGRIATGAGQSQWITGPQARRVVHRQRASHDAVMIGAGTARQDDPSLTVRGLGITRQPVRVVVSRRLDLPLMGALARSAQDVPLWLCHGPEAAPELQEAWSGLGARLIACPSRAGQLDPDAVLQALGTAGLTRVFCEGGGQLAASLLQADLVDRLVVFSAGLGIGAEGLPAIGALGLATLDEATRFRLVETMPVSGDVMHRWTRD